MASVFHSKRPKDKTLRRGHRPTFLLREEAFPEGPVPVRPVWRYYVSVYLSAPRRCFRTGPGAASTCGYTQRRAGCCRQTRPCAPGAGVGRTQRTSTVGAGSRELPPTSPGDRLWETETWPLRNTLQNNSLFYFIKCYWSLHFYKLVSKLVQHAF